MSPTDPQQPPQAGAAPHSVDLVVVDLAERKRHGVAKYGVAHQHDNGRDHLIDLYQELLDATVYIRAEIERQKSDRVAVLEKALDELLAESDHAEDCLHETPGFLCNCAFGRGCDVLDGKP